VPKDTDDDSFKPVNKHLLTPLERQRLQVSNFAGPFHRKSKPDVPSRQVEKLLKDPTREVHIPGGPREKTLRPPKEMIKNVSGSSAGVSLC